MSSEQFEQKLRERLAQAEIAPPPALWEQIRAGIAPPPRRRRPLLWMWWSMAAVSLLGMGLLWVNVEPAVQPAAIVVEPVPAAPEQPCSSPASPAQLPPAPRREAAAPVIPSRNSAISTKEESHFSPEQPTSTPDLPTSVEPKVNPALAFYDPVIPGSAATTTEFGGALSPLAPAEATSLGHHPVLPASRLILPSILPGRSKWSLDLGLSTAYAATAQSTIFVSKSYSADFVGYANRGLETQMEEVQVASVRFPIWYLGLTSELGYAVAPRWRVSAGLLAQIGYGGRAVLGDVTGEDFVWAPVASFENALDSSNVQFQSPAAFQHYSVGLPLSLYWIQPLGKGHMEHGVGWTLLRSWASTGRSLNQQEALQFDLGTNNSQNLPAQPPVSSPILEVLPWQSRLSLQTRYVAQAGSRLQWVLGAEISTQVNPAFAGQAAEKQRPFQVGLELGVRLR